MKILLLLLLSSVLYAGQQNSEIVERVTYKTKINFIDGDQVVIPCQQSEPWKYYVIVSSTGKNGGISWSDNLPNKVLDDGQLRFQWNIKARQAND